MTSAAKLKRPSNNVGAMPSAPATQAAPGAGSRLRHSVSVRIAGPSPSFIARTRNPELEPPARFEPTLKREGDVVI